MKVPRQCPLVLVKVGWREGKAFRSGEGREMRSGARKEAEQNLTAFHQNFEFWYWQKFRIPIECSKILLSFSPCSTLHLSTYLCQKDERALPGNHHSRAHLNYIYKCSPYLKENTTLHRYKHQLIDVLWGNHNCLFRESYKKHKYTMSAKCRVTEC
jgi:hypothetical protein